MKSKSLIIAMALFSGFFTSHGVERDIVKIWNDPDPLLREIRSQIEDQSGNHEEDKALAENIKTLAYAISVELNAAESLDWATPSAERKAVIQKWADILAPETQQLVDLAFVQGRFGHFETRSSVQARSLLDYAPSSPAFADQVRKYIHQSRWVAFAAADLLYEHRLLTDADKEDLRELRPDADRESDLARWAVGMGSLGMLDGLEIAKKALSKKPHGKTPEEITDPYLNFLRIVNSLGPEAAILLPEIEALIADPFIISSGYLQKFEYARDVLTGKEPRQGRYAVNGSGPLSPWLESESLGKPESGVPGSKPSPELKRPTEQEPKLITETEKSPSPTRWPLVAVVILAVLGLLLVLLKERK
jgi:hypothetical protein